MVTSRTLVSWVKTDMAGNEGAPLDISNGGKTSVWLATLPQTAGGFFHMQQSVPW